ncbi:MAG: amino-acid N-acetyltransferase [Spirochaetaceae bacterium]|nr:MAG: amino-acid N-acetyltransferase [Spirochaetaceae bacterium]
MRVTVENDALKDHVDTIREVFFYANRFKGRTFVIQIEYGIIAHPLLSVLVKDLVLLHRAGIRIVIVPGARQRIDDVLERYGVETRKHNGVRISTPDAIPFIKMAAFDASNRVMTLLSANDTNAVIGNWVRARSLGVVDGVDYHNAGVVEKVKINLLTNVLDDHIIPIFPCIGWSVTGKPYNISSRELAATLAIELKADKLFYVAETNGIEPSSYRLPEGIDIAPDGHISRMTLLEAGMFVEMNQERTDDTPTELVSLAHRAGAHGVERVHIVDGRAEGVVLKEIFSNLGFGTMIHANQYQSIRPMRIEDVTDVVRLMDPFVRKGILVKRTEAEMAERFRDYVVYETDGSIHGCGALHAFDDATAEIAGLAVDPKYDHLGIGQKIVGFLIDRARTLRLNRVFVLTTQTSDWFDRLGFRAGDLSDIPDARRATYNTARNSRVFVFELE